MRVIATIGFSLLPVALAATALAQDEPPTATLPPEEPEALPEAPPPPPAAQPASPPQYAPPPQVPAPYPYAPEPPPPPPPPEPPVRNVTLTFSPIHLLFPVFEAMAEIRVANGFGIAAIGGYGEIAVEDVFGNDYKFTAYVVGGQIAGYLQHPFHGLQLGAEVLYLKVETKEEVGTRVRVTGVGDGLAIGPFVGYKLVTEGGFTFLVQGGAQYMAVRAEAKSGDGQFAQEEDSRLIPLLNLNIGWSF
jgi:hypothetical protein